MKWLLRFVAWATLLAIPCWFVSQAYQRELARVASAALSVVGQGVQIENVEVMAPFDLAIFAAMCLASLSAPWPARRRALLVGIPTLMALEVVTVALGIGAYLLWPEDSRQLDTGIRLTGYLIESIPWVSAAAVWLALLGAWELRIAPSGGAPQGRPAGGPRGRARPPR